MIDTAAMQVLSGIDQRLQDINVSLLQFGFAELPSLRDQFAMSALTGLLADESGGEGAVYPLDKVVTRAYKIADAMLAARGTK